MASQLNRLGPLTKPAPLTTDAAAQTIRPTYNRPVHISLRNLSHDYGPSEESGTVHVLDAVSLEIPTGDFAVLMGASGSGKSTLLNIIGAVDQPSSGEARLDDVDTARLTERQLTELRRVSIGFVFQFFNLIPTLTVFENVAFPLSLVKTPRSVVKQRASEVLESVGLAHRGTHYPNELSGGEMQRAAIGRAIVHRPRLLLADEPTGNLDSKTGVVILELLREIHQTLRPTIVMATHSDAAARYGDYVIRVADGRIATESTRPSARPSPAP
jgi:putative ABC transport system ATP-binding protein